MTHPYFEAEEEKIQAFKENTPTKLRCYSVSKREDFTAIQVEKHDYFYGWLADFLAAHGVIESNYNEWRRYEVTEDKYEPFGDGDEVIVVTGSDRIFLILRGTSLDSSVFQTHLDMIEPQVSEADLPGHNDT